MAGRTVKDQNEKSPTLPNGTVFPEIAKVQMLDFKHSTVQILTLLQIVTKGFVSNLVSLLSDGRKELRHPPPISNMSSAHPRKRDLLVPLPIGR